MICLDRSDIIVNLLNVFNLTDKNDIKTLIIISNVSTILNKSVNEYLTKFKKFFESFMNKQHLKENKYLIGYAIMFGDFDVFLYIKKKYKIEFKDLEKMVYMEKSILNNNFETLKYIHEIDKAYDNINYNRWLSWSIHNNNYEITMWIYNIITKNKSDITELDNFIYIKSAENGFIELIKKFYYMSNNSNYEISKEAFIISCKYNNKNIALWFLELYNFKLSKILINEIYTTLCINGNISMLEWFSEIYKKKKTNMSFIVACTYGHINIAKWLIEEINFIKLKKIQ